MPVRAVTMLVGPVGREAGREEVRRTHTSLELGGREVRTGMWWKAEVHTTQKAVEKCRQPHKAPS